MKEGDYAFTQVLQQVLTPIPTNYLKTRENVRLKPVKGLQWGIDVGLLRVPGFTTQTDGDNAVAVMDLTIVNHVLPFFPNAQITVAWGF